jgi:hypothetical protein
MTSSDNNTSVSSRIGIKVDKAAFLKELSIGQELPNEYVGSVWVS